MRVSEEELRFWMVQAQAGQAQDYEKLLSWLDSALERYVAQQFRRWGLGDGEISDVVQEVLLAIHAKRHTYDAGQPLLPWVYAIARFKIVDHLRRQKKWSQHFEVFDDVIHESSLEGEAGPGEGQMDWSRVSAQLTEKQRQVLELVKLKGLSVAEASLQTGYSPSDIKVTVHRALAFLKKWVREEGQ